MAPRELWLSGGQATGSGSGGHNAGELLLRIAREPPSGTDAEQQVRVHPGIIAAVVVVALLALLAAIFIIKKYCFPQSNITYRYSTLRSHHEELDNSTTTRLQEDSDEDLLD